MKEKSDTTLTAAQCWWVLEAANWKARKDYKAIGEEMRKIFRRDVLVAVFDFYKARMSELKIRLEDHAEEMTGDRHGYYNVGDDGFNDLLAHIIGLGEKFYNNVIKYPRVARAIVDDRSYVESFAYIFHYALPSLVGKEVRPTKEEVCSKED